MTQETNMSNNPQPTCATCGYSWPKGQDGSHSCASVLKSLLEQKEKELEELKKILPKNQFLLNPENFKRISEILHPEPDQNPAGKFTGEGLARYMPGMFAPLSARYIRRNPDPGKCRVLSIDWGSKKLVMSNGRHTYIPYFTEVEIFWDIVPESPNCCAACKHENVCKESPKKRWNMRTEASYIQCPLDPAKTTAFEPLLR